jgi:hypothetical protein
MAWKLVVVLTFAAVAPALTPPTASAQIHPIFGGDAAFRSRYVWRGLTRANGWVMQPDVYLSVQRNGIFLNAGWWGNVQLSGSELSDPGDIGFGKTWFGEDNLWLEVSGLVGSLDVEVGLVRYLFDESAEAVHLNTFNTTELYATLAREFGALYPKLGVWYDVDEVKGAYLEASADLRVPTLPLPYPMLTLDLGAVAGWSVGQAFDPEQLDQAAYYADDGLTHVDVYSRLQVGVAQIYLSVEAHFEIKIDDLTKRTSAAPAGAESDTQWWFGIGISASTEIGPIR